MNILLIHPYITTNTLSTMLTEPLGLMALATYMKEVLGDKINVSILDLYALGNDEPVRKDNLYVFGISDKDEIGTQLEKYRPDFIGIHCNFTGFSQDAYEVAAIVKQSLPHVPVALGGAHATMEAESILGEHPAIDFIVCGEGELTMNELISSLMGSSPKEFRDIKGLCFRTDHDEVVRTPDRELIADLNQLPFPDRTFIDSDFYMRMNLKSLPFSKQSPLGIIMTSRGCPFNCIFCSTKIMWKRRWRAFSAERVIEDVKFLVDTYGVREIVIYDDQFIIDKKRVHKICDYLIENKFDITLTIPAGTSVWLLDEPLLRKMKQAGFYRLCYPIESGNERSIQFIRKKINLNDVLEKIKLANKIGYWTQGNFILGFPYETRAEIERTIEYAYNCGLDYVFFYIAKPFAGSEMYEIYKKEGLLDKVGRSSQIFISDCDTTNLTSEELNVIHAKAVKGFLPRKILWYLKPYNLVNYLLPKFKTISDIRYALKLFKLIVIGKLVSRFKKL